MRRVCLLVSLAACSVPPPTVVKDSTQDTDAPEDYSPGNTIDTSDTAPDWGDETGLEVGDSGSAPTDTSGGRYFQPETILFRAYMGVNDAGEVVPFQLESQGQLITVDAEVDVLFINAFDEVCVMAYLLESGPGGAAMPGGSDSALQAWLNGQGLKAGVAVREGGYTAYGPALSPGGGTCGLDGLDPALFTADPHLGFLEFDPAGSGEMFVGVGGTVAADVKTNLVTPLAGQNGYPVAQDWIGAGMQAPFAFGTAGGTPTDQADGASYAEVVSPQMVTTAAPNDFVSMVGVRNGPIPRGVYIALPALSLTFN